MPAASLIPLRIAVTSDNSAWHVPSPASSTHSPRTVCPFCFIGLRKLQAALRTSPYTSGAEAVFAPQLHFLPYQLDPTLPKAQAVDKRERYMRKFGPRFVQMESMMKERGAEEGIHL
jgi:predicted DsbA family dithiol-disulfide isomerase